MIISPRVIKFMLSTVLISLNLFHNIRKLAFYEISTNRKVLFCLTGKMGREGPVEQKRE